MQCMISLLRYVSDTLFLKTLLIMLLNLQVIIEVAPETLYNVFLAKVFKDSLFVMSSHKYGNFVVQTLVSSARTKDEVLKVTKIIFCFSNNLLLIKFLSYDISKELAV